jgi:putative DNA primase/helicase
VNKTSAYSSGRISDFATVAEIAQHLHGRKSGAGWVARCPAHDDTNPSLSLRYADGKVLAHCHAGCEQASVIAALKASGLWPEHVRRERRAIVAMYDYRDETGQLLYQVVRTEPKGFFQRRPDGHGGWINKKSKRQVLYRLREMLENPIVFVVEGEKDVETLRQHGFVATTNSGGAGKWRDEFSQCFRHKEVLILPDADAPGWRHALDIARSIVGIAARVQMIELPLAKDPAEWFARGHSELELIALVEEGSEACHQ